MKLLYSSVLKYFSVIQSVFRVICTCQNENCSDMFWFDCGTFLQLHFVLRVLTFCNSKGRRPFLSYYWLLQRSNFEEFCQAI